MITGGALSVIVIALIVTAIILLSDSSNAAPVDDHGRTISLEDILEGRFNPKSFNGTWVSGNDLKNIQ